MLRLSWGEVLKWIVLVAGIASTYAVMQTKIAALEEGREENHNNIVRLEERMRALESQISSINEKTTQIGSDVTIIKNAILTNGLNDH